MTSLYFFGAIILICSISRVHLQKPEEEKTTPSIKNPNVGLSPFFKYDAQPLTSRILPLSSVLRKLPLNNDLKDIESLVEEVEEKLEELQDEISDLSTSQVTDDTIKELEDSLKEIEVNIKAEITIVQTTIVDKIEELQISLEGTIATECECTAPSGTGAITARRRIKNWNRNNNRNWNNNWNKRRNRN